MDAKESQRGYESGDRGSDARAMDLVRDIRAAIARRVVGQHRMVDSLIAGIIARGHVLVEGVPGLAKTLAVKSLAEACVLDYKRVQFTPDLLPADLVGTTVYLQASGEFVARKGPIFAGILLADEINRAPAKVQSALLEAMEERQATIGDKSYKLPDPFFVLATQNPIEHEGTYPLPEAELDRFLFKLKVDYPSLAEEEDIVIAKGKDEEAPINPVARAEDILYLQRAAQGIAIDKRIVNYIVRLAQATRPSVGGMAKSESDNEADFEFLRYIEFGASPRASICLARCARARALMEGRLFVLPEDVKYFAPDVLRHRLILNYEAEADGLDAEAVVKALLSHVRVP